MTLAWFGGVGPEDQRERCDGALPGLPPNERMIVAQFIAQGFDWPCAPNERSGETSNTPGQLDPDGTLHRTSLDLWVDERVSARAMATFLLEALQDVLFTEENHVDRRLTQMEEENAVLKAEAERLTVKLAESAAAVHSTD